jgi:ABC-2 type transport system ATP-binding protein
MRHRPAERPVAKVRIGYLPETPPLYRELTVAEYLRLAARLHRLPRAECETAVNRAMQRCGLAEVSRKLIGALSKGYQQRVGIAQAIVHEPDLIILDEPTVGLTPNQILDIRLIREPVVPTASSCRRTSSPKSKRFATACRSCTTARWCSATIAGLREFQRGRTVTSSYRPPPIEKAFPTVDDDGEGRFRIRFAPDVDPTAALVACRRRLGPAPADTGADQP